MSASSKRARKLALIASREDGFTLIELLVVVIIIAILAAIAVPVYIGIQNNAKKSGIASDVATTKLNVAAALTEDGTVNSGTYTTAAKDGDAQIQNSGIGGDEWVKVTMGDGNQYTVEGGSDKLSMYNLYDSSTGQATASSAPSVPKGTVVYDMENSSIIGNSGSKQVYTNNLTTDKAHSGTHSIYGNLDNSNLQIYPAAAGVNTVGKKYIITAYVYIQPGAGSWFGVTMNLNGSLDTSGGYNTAAAIGPGYPYQGGTADQVGKWVKLTTPTVVLTSANPVLLISSESDTAGLKYYVDDVTFTPVN